MLYLSTNILLLLFLYFIQGLPYGFQVQFLPLHLHAIGLDLTNIGLMRLLHVPWLCKAVWAPYIDKYWTKRKWLLLSISGLIATSALMSLISSHNITLLCVFLLLLNLFASTQDIAVDGIAISLLSVDELGTGNTAQVVGYKIGSIFGGGVLIWCMDHIGWFGLFMALTILYIEAFMFVYVSPSLRYHESRLLQWAESRKKVDSWQNYSYNSCHEPEEEWDETLDNRNKAASLLAPHRDSIEEVTHSNHVEDNNSNIDNKQFLNGSNGLEGGSSPRNNFAGHSFSRHHGNASFYGDEFGDDDLIDAEHLQATISLRKKEEHSLWTQLLAVISVRGTKWLIVFVLIYKLGEQGALGMFPLFLVDQHVSASEVGFWSGVVGQTASISGSLLGGWLISNQRLPVDFVLQQFSILRLFPLGLQLLIILAWNSEIIPTQLLYYPAVVTLTILMLLSGVITTATFTLMMQCSRQAAPCLQASHYTSLATLEVFGKLTFMTMAGWLVDRLGFPAIFFLFLSLTLVSSLWFRRCPPELRSRVDETGKTQ